MFPIASLCQSPTTTFNGLAALPSISGPFGMSDSRTRLKSSESGPRCWHQLLRNVRLQPIAVCLGLMYLQCRYRTDSLKSKVQKWGNSLALRIPSAFAEEVGVKDGSEVEISLTNRTLMVVPAARPPSLKQLLARVSSKNLHHETDTGKPRGREVW